MFKGCCGGEKYCGSNYLSAVNKQGSVGRWMGKVVRNDRNSL